MANETEKIKFYLKKYSWLVIMLAVGLGLLKSDWGMVIKPYNQYLLMALMFLSCVNIDLTRSLKHLNKIRKILLSMIVIFLLSSIIVYFFRESFDKNIYLGLVLATSMPAGISVVFLSQLYGGSTAKSLVISVLSNVISPLIVPLVVLWLAGMHIEVNVWDMFLNICKLVLVPIVLARVALIIGLKKVVDNNGTYISIICLFLLIWGVIAPVQSVLFSTNGLGFLVLIVLFLVLLNIIFGLWLGSDWKAKKTYAISLSYKNFSLAMVLALSLFGPVAAVPAAIYTIVNNLMLIPLQILWSKDE